MTRADRVVIVLAALLVGVAAGAYWQPRTVADRVEVQVGDGTPQVYSLDTQRHIEVHGALGTSMLEIEVGRIRFVSSPCRNKVCIHSGWLSMSGDATACLPNRVTIALLGHGAPEIDAVSQ